MVVYQNATVNDKTVVYEVDGKKMQTVVKAKSMLRVAKDTKHFKLLSTLTIE